MALTLNDLLEMIYMADPRPQQFYQNVLAFVPPERRHDLPLTTEPLTLDENVWGVAQDEKLSLFGRASSSDILLTGAARKLRSISHPDDIDVEFGESVIWTVRRILSRFHPWFKDAFHVSPSFLYEWFREAYVHSQDRCFKRLRDVHKNHCPHFLDDIRAFVRYMEPLLNEMGYYRQGAMRRPVMRSWDVEGLSAEFHVDLDIVLDVVERTKSSRVICFHRGKPSN